MLYLLLSNNIYSLINYIQVSYWIAIGGAILALFYFRKTMPDAPRAVKAPIVFPIIFFIGCVLLVLVPVLGNPKDTAIGILIMLSGVPVYLIFIAWKGKPKCIDSLTGNYFSFWSPLINWKFQIPSRSSRKSCSWLSTPTKRNSVIKTCSSQFSALTIPSYHQFSFRCFLLFTKVREKLISTILFPPPPSPQFYSILPPI